MFRKRIAEICQTETPFSGVVEVDESYFGAKRVQENQAEVFLGKHQFLVSFKEKEKYILGSIRIVPEQHCKRLCAAEFLLIVSFTPKVGEATTVWLI